MSNKIGLHIKELRGKRSLREMERLTGVSHTYLMRVESGKDHRSGNPIIPTPETLRKIAKSTGENYINLMFIAGHLTERDLNDLLKMKKVGE